MLGFGQRASTAAHGIGAGCFERRRSGADFGKTQRLALRTARFYARSRNCEPRARRSRDRVGLWVDTCRFGARKYHN